MNPLFYSQDEINELKEIGINTKTVKEQSNKLIEFSKKNNRSLSAVKYKFYEILRKENINTKITYTEYTLEEKKQLIEALLNPDKKEKKRILINIAKKHNKNIKTINMAAHNFLRRFNQQKSPIPIHKEIIPKEQSHITPNAKFSDRTISIPFKSFELTNTHILIKY